MSEPIILEEVILIWPQLHEPDTMKDYPDSKPRWGATFLLNKQNKQHMEYLELIKTKSVEAVKETMGKKFDQETYGSRIKPWQDGAKWDNDNLASTLQDFWVLSSYRTKAKESTTPPFAVEGYDPEVHIPPEDIQGRFKDGNIVSACVHFYITPKNKERVCCALHGVQWISAGEPMQVGGVKPSNVFKKHKKSIAPEIIKESTEAESVTETKEQPKLTNDDSAGW